MPGYDVLIWGAGPAGLYAACMAAKAGKKTLVLGVGGPGELWGEERAGRFRWQLRSAAVYSEPYDEAAVLLQEVGINTQTEFAEKSEPRRFVGKDGNPDTEIPFSAEELTRKLAGCCTGSREAVEDLCELARQSADGAVKLLRRPDTGTLSLLLSHRSFLKTAGHSVKEVMDALNMPGRAGELLACCTGLYGINEEEREFSDFSLRLCRQCAGAPKEFTGGSYAFMLRLEAAAREAGAEIWHNCVLKKLQSGKNGVTAVLAGGYTLQAKVIIADRPEADVLAAAELSGSTSLSGSGFSVLLGLGKSKTSLGIRQQEVLLHGEGGLKEENDALRSGVICRFENAEKGGKGCTAALHTLVSGEEWKALSAQEYEQKKTELSAKLIKRAEKVLHLHIKDCIEEAVVLGPREYAALGGGTQGEILQPELSASAGFLHPAASRRNVLPGVWHCGAGSRAQTLGEALTAGRDTCSLCL